MKTLFFYYKYPFYTEGSYFQEFINKYAQRGESIYLVATHYPPGKINDNKKIEFFWLPLLNVEIVGEFVYIIQALLKVITTKQLHEVDVVNSIGPRGLLAGWYLKKRYKIPLVCTIELLNEKGNFLESLAYWFEKLLLKIFPADKYICWSNYYHKNYLKKWGIAETKIRIIPGGIDVSRYRALCDTQKSRQIKNLYAPPDSHLIVFAKPLFPANTESAKLLVRALALLKQKIKLKLLVGGGKGEATVKKLAEELGVDNLVNFMPPTPFREIPNYLGAADLVILPFVYAPTTSRSLLEAMAMAKPVITTRMGETIYFLRDKHNALFVKPTPRSIAEGIGKVISDKILARRIAQNVLVLAKSRFDLGKIVDETRTTIAAAGKAYSYRQI